MFDAIVDWFKDIIKDIRERIKNPFTDDNKSPFAGAFLIALVAYNWRLVFSFLYFDSFESRLSKLEIISTFLSEEPWYSRIVFPVGISFVSIAAFYFFNNIALGVRIFLNRYWRALVLFITDRSKIIPRDEFQMARSRENEIRKEHDSINEQFIKTRNERDGVAKQLSDLTSMFDKTRSENEDLKKRLANMPKVSKPSFRVLFAKYRMVFSVSGSTENIVTDVVNKKLSQDVEFQVRNDILGGDPAPHSVKELFLIWEGKGNAANELVVIEGDLLQLKEEMLVISRAAMGDDNRRQLENQKELARIFGGLWKLTFTISKNTNTEFVMIDPQGRYFADGVESFYLRAIAFNKAERTISFSKISLDGILHSSEALNMRAGHEIIGTDSKGYKLQYRKQLPVLKI